MTLTQILSSFSLSCPFTFLINCLPWYAFLHLFSSLLWCRDQKTLKVPRALLEFNPQQKLDLGPGIRTRSQARSALNRGVVIPQKRVLPLDDEEEDDQEELDRNNSQAWRDFVSSDEEDSAEEDGEKGGKEGLGDAQNKGKEPAEKAKGLKEKDKDPAEKNDVDDQETQVEMGYTLPMEDQQGEPGKN